MYIINSYVICVFLTPRAAKRRTPDLSIRFRFQHAIVEQSSNTSSHFHLSCHSADLVQLRSRSSIIPVCLFERLSLRESNREKKRDETNRCERSFLNIWNTDRANFISHSLSHRRLKHLGCQKFLRSQLKMKFVIEWHLTLELPSFRRDVRVWKKIFVILTNGVTSFYLMK